MELIQEYFCRPIMDSSVQGYNFVNTAFYALILIAAIVLVVYPFMRKKSVKPGFGFALALIPYILFGSGLRVLNDAGYFAKTCNVLDINFFTFTPGIWVLTFAIAALGILIAKRTAKNDGDFLKHFAAIGIVFSLPVVAFEAVNFVAWDGVAIVAVLCAAITLLVKAIVEFKKKGFFANKLNVLVVAGQALDGCATFVATDLFNCGEQHPLSESILGVHPALFILVKIILALLIIHYIEQDVKDREFGEFIKIAVVILGFATGGRDLLTLGIGTCM